MTSRPGQMAEDLLRYNRGKQLAHCLRVVALDGSVLLFTDHDRQVTVEQNVYLPIVLGSLSADRREGGLRSGDQDVRGIIDGQNIAAAAQAAEVARCVCVPDGRRLVPASHHLQQAPACHHAHSLRWQ